MRFLQLKGDDTFSLVEYFGKDLPPYAILSHTWGADHEEVSLKDLIEGNGTDRDGYRKLLFCGKQAAKDNLEFFWVDTVCIDRTSSAELHEALNSMFRWYQTAVKCYAYLSDVSIRDTKDTSKSFQQSRWFTRGWTLQELIAPASVEFFSAEGDRIGDRISMIEDIHHITRIPVEVLRGSPLASFSTDERMSWAQGRETKREEDAAYSLLGIFDVYMPLIYGEGRDNALARLERKINKSGGNQVSISTPPRAVPEQIGNNLGPFSFLFKDPSLRSAADFAAFPPVQNSRTHPTEVSSGATSSNNNRQARGQSLADALKELLIQAQDNDMKPRQRDDNRTNDESFDDSQVALRDSTKNENTSLGPRTLEHEGNGDLRRKGKPTLQITSSIKASAFSLQWAELEAYVDGIVHISHENLLSNAPADAKKREQIQAADIHEVFQLLLSFKDQERAKSQNSVNDWLDVSKFNDHYSVAQYYEKQVASRLKGTCDWIFSHDAYDTWISDESHCDTAKILWIHAPAGHGKSVLCARIVEQLKSEQSKFVAYFFASPHAQSGGMPDFVVRSWIAQMAQLDPDVLQLVKQNSMSGQRASDIAVWKIFESIISDGHNYVFVLDGFDEYSRSENVRSQFLQKLKKATDQTTARVLITSRNETDIESELSSEPSDDNGTVIIRCRITHEDVDNDISLFSKSLVDEKLPRKDERLRQELAGQLAQKCEGMFLWIKMQQDQLRGGKNAKQLQKIVNNMPAGLMKTYERNWNTILDHCHEDRANALAILKWATFAFRPLSVLEVTEALIVDLDDGDITLRRDDLPDEINEDYINGEIIDICGGLVEVRNEDTVDLNSAKTLHLIHASVRDFLLSGLFSSPTDLNRSETIPVPPADHSHQHFELATVCLGYLSNHDIWDQRTECESSDHKHDFVCYATRYWNKHVTAGGQNKSELLPLLKSFFRIGNPGFEHWSRYISSLEPTVNEDEEDESKDIPGTPLYYAALLNLSELMEEILLDDKSQLNQLGGIYGTPLQAACLKGHDSAFQILLKWGADPNTRGGRFGVPINAAIIGKHVDMIERLMRLDLNYALKDPRGRTTFYTAAKHGDYKTAHALLEAGAEQATPNKYGWTPLNVAADRGDVEIVKMLLERGAEITAANDNKDGPLHSAAEGGYLEVVKLLLDKGVDVGTPNAGGWTPLNLAADDGHLDVIKLLVEKMDTNVDVANKNGWTPLNSAASNGHAEVVKFLIEKGASINTTNNNKDTPLQVAACNGNLDVVKLLLEYNADMTIADNIGCTPLNSAACNGHLEIVKLLLEKGAAIESANDEKDTPLQVATLDGHFDVVKLLLEHNADVATVDGKNWTPLSVAASKGHLEIAKFLLENGADWRTANSSGLTPLHIAAYNGHPSIIKLLLDQGADLTIVDTDNSTPIASAARFGHLEAVKLLLENGADIHIADNEQSTPFTLAARFGHLEVVKLLLEKGVDLNTPDTAFNWTPLATAATNGHLDVVKLLLDRGAEIISNSDGWTPLNAAASNGHLEIVKLLLEKGADMTPNSNGWDPLGTASNNGHIEVVRLLLERNVEMTANIEGWTPLSAAATSGHLEIVKMLLEKGADIATVNKVGWTPLSAAADSGHLDVAEFLFDITPNINLPVPRHGTLWHVFANRGYTNLLKSGYQTHHADLCAVSPHGHTCLHLAARKGHVELFQYLLSLDLQCPEEDAKGDGLLSHALCGGSEEIIKMLIDRDSKTPFESKNWTPLHWACREASAKVVEMLIQAGHRSKLLTTSRPEGKWSPLSVAMYHGNKDVMENLSESSKALIGIDTEDVQLQGERHGGYWCDACFNVCWTSRLFERC
jgi:ankyrin repeat protein